MSREIFPRPTPSFVGSLGPGGEGDSFGLQGAGSSSEQAGFSRGFSAALRYRLPLRKETGWTRENPFPPGFLVHRSPPQAILAGGKLGVGERFCPASLSLLIAARVQEGKALGFRVPALIIKRPRGLRVHGEEGVREGSFTQGPGERNRPDSFPLYIAGAAAQWSPWYRVEHPG